jgi:RNA exonuclease 1
MSHHPRGRPGLAWLTKKWCGREIQTRDEGHDPEEDACACLDLLKKKLEEGPGFGEFKTDQESIFERFGRASRKHGSGAGGGVRSAVMDYGNPVQMHGNKATTALACKTDEEIVEGLLGVVRSHDFVFARLTALADTLGWITPRAAQDTPVSTSPAAPQPPTSPTGDQLQSTLASLNTNLSKIHASLPPRTAFVLFTGHSDPRRMTQLNSRKAQFDNALRAGKSPEEIATGENGVRWTAADGRVGRGG